MTMQTLQVLDGDLVLSNGAFATITAAAKVAQDIEIAVLTPYGSDRFHARYGSVFESYVGQPSSPQTSALISAELTRVINNYMAVQLGQVKSAVAAGGQSPFGQNELVSSIGPITVQQQLDAFQVTASVSTASGQLVNVSTSVS
jgi:phage baseplate assembly protein W